MGYRPAQMGRSALNRRQRIDPRRIKIHLSYTVEDLARLFACHKQTVRNWLKQGLASLNDGKRPLLMQGGVARTYLETRRRDTKRRCKTDELYCLSCREPRAAEKGTLRLEHLGGPPAMLSGTCSLCGNRMFKRVSAGAAVDLQTQIEREAEGRARTLKQAD